jgi:hypothetical protein
MFLVRDVFKCKPGKAKELVEKFKKSMSLLAASGDVGKYRILVDFVSSYWTVVLETEIKELNELEKHMSDWAARKDVQEAMSGYMDSVAKGHREIFRIA